MVDALALRADERRDKLRKASGRSTYPMIRRYLNGETRQRKPLSACSEYIAVRGEPGELKHLSTWRKRKKFDSVSSGERTRNRPNQWSLLRWGCGHTTWMQYRKWRELESSAIEGNSPVVETRKLLVWSRVPRDTWNPVGSRRDHPPSLNTT